MLYQVCKTPVLLLLFFYLLAFFFFNANVSLSKCQECTSISGVPDTSTEVFKATTLWAGKRQKCIR